MNKENYLKLAEKLNNRAGLLKGLIITQKLMETAVYIIYPLFLLVMLLTHNDLWWKSATVCGLGFIAVSLIRRRLNLPRPYEVYDTEPLLKKDKKGCSFPSRHAFSATIIAVNVAAFCLPWGIVLFTVALAIAALRVVLGVHFIKDIAAGLALGAVLGLVVWFL